MNKNKKACPAGSAAGQAERERHSANGDPQNNCIIWHGPISRLLMEGQENGLHLQDLVKITGWTEREVRQQIHIERRHHTPILSNNRDGYYLPSSPQERNYCVRSLRHRAQEILAVAEAIEENEENIKGEE